ncbi:MAG: sigma-70 family RNA polymerase sigma factor [Polyangiaceae bacterium]|nr:sigma-70 family RNA polymerase sigma factor [Polyangiaceae bacterium]
MPIVVGKLCRRLAPYADEDELTSLARAALVEVVRRHDPERAPLVPYVVRHLEWAVLDELRRLTHVRAIKARALALETASRLLAAREEADAGASPAGTGSDPMSLPSQEEFRARLRGLLASQASALATALSASGGEPADPADNPEDKLTRDTLAARIRASVAELPERERALVERHYFGEERFDVIAADLGVSKSRASRLHAQAIETLGRRLRREV